MSFDAASILIRPLAPDHDRASFTCGNAALDRYLREQAGQDVRRATARVFVAAPADQPERVLGYFTLSAALVVPADLPAALERKLPKHAIPAALIGRLAVDNSTQGRGLGGVLIADAVRKIRLAAETVAMAVIVVDPIDGRARAFYAAFGFQGLNGPQRRMFIAMQGGRAGSAP
ncbi:GNAT family N-acetyltransferase [Phaeospirillum tilakii]|uniref:GNAT family N-acetyltransferase n=1 Tax=Phaeospirillum tilakii TaxID=741673 RepID=A0ABW5C5I9_9PROT